jgi:hypothetical protein
MKFRAVAIVSLWAAMLAGTNAQARGPFGSINVGNWNGGAYSNDQTGAFTHCSAGSQSTSGIFFMVMIDNGGGCSLAFAHDKWSLKTGEVFPLTLTFDGQQPFNVHGIPLAEKLVRVPMPITSWLITEFRKARAMMAYTQGQLFQFNFDQTAQLLPALVNCVEKIKQGGVANAGDFSVPVARPVAATTTAPPGARPAKPDRLFDQTTLAFSLAPAGMS